MSAERTKKWTGRAIRESKGSEKLVCLTAHDYSTARILDEAGIQLVLVGDSLAVTALGYENTLPVTMNEMMHHTRAVARGVKNALVVADMPFLSYQASIEEGVRNAGLFVKEGGAGAVKIEGGAFRAPLVKELVANGIPVLGHIGLTPQSIKEMGGYKVQGRGSDEAEKLKRDAVVLDKAGVFAMVLECVPAGLASEITGAVAVPTIGIGAGAGCDGQVLVTYDMLGLYPGKKPSFVKQYADLGAEITRAVSDYIREVRDGSFPDKERQYQ